MRPDYDCIIAGGGPIGVSIALALDAIGVRTVVVEARRPGDDGNTTWDERGLALTLSSAGILEAVGVWPALGDAVAPIRAVHVSERGRFGALRIEAAVIGRSALGYVVIARRLGRALLDTLGRSRCEYRCPARVEHVRAGDADVTVTLAGSGERLRARLLIGADGAQSRVRECLALKTQIRDYGQTAVVAAITPERDHGGIAFERFTPEGPCALLPLPGRRAVLVWVVPHADAAGVSALADEDFARAASERYGLRLGRLSAPGPRTAYPLRLLRALEQCAARTVLVGNAAHVVHPNAAQGLNLGLRDAAVLAEHVAAHVRAGTDFGDAPALAAYVAARKPDQDRVITLSDGLVRVFYNRIPVLGTLRQLGLVGLDLLPPAKRALARAATGLAGRTPRLALGLPL
ncbi:MAG: 2-octaprenyl-6-methoxyphenyl hydroxylase [Gammaproteobacteria bacterium]|nr:2-octaprenyl-6-methoxyphenyl hydroxylase [Gammaproteobacteria bacterium]